MKCAMCAASAARHRLADRDQIDALELRRLRRRRMRCPNELEKRVAACDVPGKRRGIERVADDGRGAAREMAL
jgi:hypothetical protein